MIYKFTCHFGFLYVTLPRNNIGTTMEGIAEYRARILQALMNAKDTDCKPRLTERQANLLANELEDNELEIGRAHV